MSGSKMADKAVYIQFSSPGRISTELQIKSCTVTTRSSC